MTTSKIWLGFGSLQQQSARRSRRWHQNISVDKSAGVKRLALSHQVTFLYPLWQRLFTTNISCVNLNEGTRGRVQDDDDEGDESFILRAPRGEARAAWPRRKVTPRDSMPPPPPPRLVSCSPEWTARGRMGNNKKNTSIKRWWSSCESVHILMVDLCDPADVLGYRRSKCPPKKKTLLQIKKISRQQLFHTEVRAVVHEEWLATALANHKQVKAGTEEELNPFKSRNGWNVERCCAFWLEQSTGKKFKERV